MALVDTIISQVNNGSNTVTLTYDDVTLAVTKVAWNNPVGHWTWTVTRAGQPDITRTLSPGQSGSTAVPVGYTWAVAKGQSPNFGYQDSWTRE